MIFHNPIRSAKAAKDYYSQHIAPGDYYGKDSAESKGIWHGAGAEKLGLSGEVSQADFFKLCDNINPKTGERLTPRTNDDRRVLIDFTFDTPKSVTLESELGGGDGKGDQRIVPALRQSVRETMAEMEADVKTRVRMKGADEDRATANMIWADNLHRTTRLVDGKPDPQLHIHATVLNATFDQVEDRWKAIQLGDIVRDLPYYQAAFHARLASKLKELGYAIEKDGKSFRLAGISRETVEKFSRRSAVIDAEAEKRGIEDAKEKAKLGRKTREKKSKTPQSMRDLRKEWDSRLTPQERLALRMAGSGWEQGDATITSEQAKEYALEHSFQNASAVSERRLKAEALMHAVGSVKPEDVADIAQHREAIPVKHEGQVFITTKTVLRDEVAMLQFAKDGQRKQKPLVPAREQKAEKSSKTSESSRSGTSEEFLAGLSTEQKKAALHILNSRDTVVGVRGGAGTGKTHMLQTMNAVISSIESRSGHYSHVFAFAQSATASRGGLAKVGFRDAQTLAMLFKSEKLQKQLHRQVLLIDEAGLVSSKEMRTVFDIAKQQQARVILVGDYRQHASVEAGDAFRLIEKEAGVHYAELREIRRQTEPGYRKAVEAISTGTGNGAQKGFDALDKMGYIIESDGEKRHAQLVFDYLRAEEDGKSALIIAPTHAEGQKLTDEVRAQLKERGAIGQERQFKVRRSTGWTQAQKGDVRNYEPGMIVDFHEAVAGKRRRIAGQRVTEGGFAKGEAVVVSAVSADSVTVMRRNGTLSQLPTDMKTRFQVSRARDIAIGRGDRIRNTRNGSLKVKGQAKGTDVNNGDLFTVEGFTKEGHIRLPNGKIMPKDWGHFDLGYVDTSYASQGKTVDRVFVALGKISLAAADAKQWYVSLSRGREMAKVYLEDKQEVRQAISRTGERLSAVELTGTRLASNWRQRFYQSLERNRVGRFLIDRADSLAGYWKDRTPQKEIRYA